MNWKGCGRRRPKTKLIYYNDFRLEGLRMSTMNSGLVPSHTLTVAQLVKISHTIFRIVLIYRSDSDDMKSLVCYVIMLCSSETAQRFGGIYRFHYQSGKIGQEADSKLRCYISSVNLNSTNCSSITIIWDWYNRPNSGRSKKWTLSHPTKNNNKKCLVHTQELDSANRGSNWKMVYFCRTGLYFRCFCVWLSLS
jgi:hypothetical protein